MKTTTFNNAFVSTRWQGRVIGTLLKHSHQTEQTTFGFQRGHGSAVQLVPGPCSQWTQRKWSNETGQWRNTQTTGLMSPAHKLCCCSEVPFQHVPFFGRWWRRMLRPRGHRGPCGPRLERVTANEWLCHGYLHTAPCGFEKMAKKKLWTFCPRICRPRLLHVNVGAYLEHPPLSCLGFDSLSAIASPGRIHFIFVLLASSWALV